MKNNFFILLALIVSLCGCDDTGLSQVGEIKLASGSKDVVEIDADGGKETVRFSSALDWHVEFSEGWLTVDPMEGGPGTAKIVISAQANETTQAREAVVNICTSGLEYPVKVSQEPYVPTFDLLDTEAQISSLGGEVTVRVYTDVDFEVQCDADWVTSPSTKAPRTRKVTFNVEPNTLPEGRQATITFRAGDLSRDFTLTQRPAGTEAEDWKHEPFVDRSLAMRFTATWCGYCPMMATAFESAKVQMGESLVLVNLHEINSNYGFSGTETLLRRFKVSGFPSGIVDARALIQNYSSTATTAAVAMDVAEETGANYPAKSGIACKSTLDGTSLTVDLSLYFKEADDYKVTVLLLEDGIVGYQNGGDNNYRHDDVARLAVTSISGDAVKVENDCTVVNKTYTATVKSNWQAENLEVLVYVEKPYGSQSKVKGVSGASYGNYGDTYIDNCRVVKVGEVGALELQ
jgi:thiol-disulfide isomerase/thioredoxin